MLDNQSVRKRGAPYGNQNARKYSYYSPALKRKDKRDLEQAASIIGVDEEIALLRFKLKSLLASDPHNLKDFNQAILALNRLTRTQSKIAKKMGHGEALQRAIENVLRDIAIPLGVDITKPIGVGAFPGTGLDTPGTECNKNLPPPEKED